MLQIKDDKEVLIDGSLVNYLILIENDDVNIKYDISVSCNIIIINNNDNHTNLNDYGFIKNNVEVNLLYIDLNKDEYKQKSQIEVSEAAKLKVTSKYLSSSKKDIILNYINIDRYTEIEIDNSCVVTSEAYFNLECIGQINKNAKSAKNMQTSRCLVIDKPKKALIKPVLLIDENDVTAAHSLSYGTIDQDVMYYLNSRGITNHEAMILFINSYLIPSDNILDNIINKDEIMKMISSKVENLYV